MDGATTRWGRGGPELLPAALRRGECSRWWLQRAAHRGRREDGCAAVSARRSGRLSRPCGGARSSLLAQARRRRWRPRAWPWPPTRRLRHEQARGRSLSRRVGAWRGAPPGLVCSVAAAVAVLNCGSCCLSWQTST
eukprot:scaffold1558_cov403-Prasinococcus_capsulatus_cf.AAC.1